MDTKIFKDLFEERDQPFETILGYHVLEDRPPACLEKRKGGWLTLKALEEYPDVCDQAKDKIAKTLHIILNLLEAKKMQQLDSFGETDKTD
ncbi:hypothetical protein CVT26_005139 [Gymnopilus dilepis]|uniref:Uncharacterized protein n=1 Tax=Gymnopilus dilepis TaxID=231916 RepID=A0A409YTD6_9AGAR|nr:hypothetical protein CVT26_005139 [Gymnopilus dilepis]